MTVTPEELTDSRVDRTSCAFEKEDYQKKLRGALGMTGYRPEAFRGLVVVGCSEPVALALLLEALPDIRKAIVVESDTIRRGNLQAAIDSREHGIVSEQWTVLTPGIAPSGFCHRTYLGVTQFLLKNNLRHDETFFWIDAEITGTVDDSNLPSIRATKDLARCSSASFLALMSEFPGAPTAPLGRFADYLKNTGEPFHALCYYHLLAAKDSPAQYASSAVVCLETLGCYSAMSDWIPHLDCSGETDRTKNTYKERMAEESRFRRERFAHNLDTIRRRFPAVAEQIPRPEGALLHRAILFQRPGSFVKCPPMKVETADYEVFFYVKNGLITAMNHPADRRPLAEALLGRKGVLGAHLLIGALRRIDLIDTLIRCRPRAMAPYAEESVYLVERDTKHLARLMELVDLSPWIEHPYTRLFVGPSAEDDIASLFESNANHPMPHLRVDPENALINRLAAIHREHGRVAAACFKRIQRKCEASYERALAEALQGDRPLKVCIYTSIFTTALQYLARDLASGFTDLGHQVTLLQEGAADEVMHSRTVAETLDAQTFHLFIMLDHTRSRLGLPLPERMPVACWIIDELPELDKREMIERLGRRDFTYVLDSNWMERYEKIGYRNVRHLPVGVNTTVYGPHVDDGQPFERCDLSDKVAFITHAHTPTPPPFAPQLFEWAEPRLLEEERPRPAPLDYRPLALEGLKALGCAAPDDEQLFKQVLYQFFLFARMMDRMRVVDRLREAGVPFAFFGEGWGRFHRFNDIYHGELNPGPELGKVFAQSKVVLHINSNTNCHMRVFEAIAAGGFVLARSNDSDYLPGELNDRLEIGKEIVTYSTIDELLTVLERAYGDEQWRRSVIAAGQRRVLAEHNYAGRAQLMIDDILSGLEQT